MGRRSTSSWCSCCSFLLLLLLAVATPQAHSSPLPSAAGDGSNSLCDYVFVVKTGNKDEAEGGNNAKMVFQLFRRDGTEISFEPVPLGDLEADSTAVFSFDDYHDSYPCIHPCGLVIRTVGTGPFHMYVEWVQVLVSVADDHDAEEKRTFDVGTWIIGPGGAFLANRCHRAFDTCSYLVEVKTTDMSLAGTWGTTELRLFQEDGSGFDLKGGSFQRGETKVLGPVSYTPCVYPCGLTLRNTGDILQGGWRVDCVSVNVSGPMETHQTFKVDNWIQPGTERTYNKCLRRHVEAAAA